MSLKKKTTFSSYNHQFLNHIFMIFIPKESNLYCLNIIKHILLLNTYNNNIKCYCFQSTYEDLRKEQANTQWIK